MTTTTVQHLKASKTPLQDIARISYAGQAQNMKMYREGYEQFMNLMPKLNCCNDTLEDDMIHTNHVMQQLVKKLKKDGWVFTETVPEANKFNRTIIAMEEPITEPDGSISEQPELVVAQWGDHYQSPVHGHASGFLFEEVLGGTIKVNMYRIVDLENRIVRPHHTDIVREGNLISQYNAPDPGAIYKRQTLIHNFESIGTSVSLHYLPEHTRDGRDNSFIVEHWSSQYRLGREDFTRISAKDGMYLRKGEVVLVRSSNVPEYGDHFIVVTGHPVMKDHGMRVQDEAIIASEYETKFLNQFEPIMGLTLLRLNHNAKESFLKFHGITGDNNYNVTFPKL